MYIEPELLEELSEDQKQILFFKMREEQIRRYKVWTEKEEMESKLHPKNGSLKNVRFLTNDKDEIITTITKDVDDQYVVDAEAVKKREEAEALKRAEIQAKKEAEERKKKESQEIETKRLAEEKKLKEEEERLRKEREQREEELRLEAERATALASKEAKLQKERAELERKELQKKRQEEEAKRHQALIELREREEAEKKRKEEEWRVEEEKRKAELYQRIKFQKEEERKREEEEAKQLQKDWEEREVKAKEADRQRRSSTSQARDELTRQRKLAKERDLLQKSQISEEKKTCEVKKENYGFEPDVNKKVFSQNLSDEKEKRKDKKPFTFGRLKKPSSEERKKNSPTLVSATRTKSPEKPPLPVRPIISAPLAATGTRTERETIPVKKDIVKPSRPPPPPFVEAKKTSTKPPLPPRPKNHHEVVKWWKENEFDKSSGLDENKKPEEWFHGIITRQCAESSLENKQQGSYLIRVSERVWGYTISYKDIARFKHFLIDTSAGYQLFGTEQKVHASLNELVAYHKRYPISGLGQELLKYPVGQEKDPPDYVELFQEETSI